MGVVHTQGAQSGQKPAGWAAAVDVLRGLMDPDKTILAHYP